MGGGRGGRGEEGNDLGQRQKLEQYNFQRVSFGKGVGREELGGVGVGSYLFGRRIRRPLTIAHDPLHAIHIKVSATCLHTSRVWKPGWHLWSLLMLSRSARSRCAG